MPSGHGTRRGHPSMPDESRRPTWAEFCAAVELLVRLAAAGWIAFATIIAIVVLVMAAPGFRR